MLYLNPRIQLQDNLRTPQQGAFFRMLINIWNKYAIARRQLIFFLTVACLGVAAASSGSASDSVSELLSSDSPRVTPVVRAVRDTVPCVVNISTERVVRVSDPFESFFNDFFGGPLRYYRETVPLGSGIVVDEHGLLLTNRHVVQRASEITVHLWNGESCEAQYVAGDLANDLALLRIVPETYSGQLHAGRFSAPGDLLLGEPVIAVGNPFGLEHSVTSGVLSALNRSLREGDVVFDDILQTDAPINPGNSGGPLINAEGDIIGMNVAIRSDAEGIGFAIPVERIEKVLTRWLVPSRFSRAAAGLIAGTKVLKSGGTRAVVAEVLPGTPAAEVDLEPGDIIRSVNGRDVSRAMDVGRILWLLEKGDEVSIQLEDGNRPVQFRVSKISAEMYVERRLGLQLQGLTAPLRKALALPEDVRGLIVSDIKKDSQQPELNVRRGDIVVKIDKTPVSTVDDVYEVIKKHRSGETLPMTLLTAETRQERRFLRQLTIGIRLE